MKKLNKNEEIARQNVIGAFNWIVGGYINSIQDGINFLPNTIDELKDEIYLSSMNNGYLIEGSEQFNKAPREMRFCGREFIKSVIEELCKSDSDFDTILDYINNKY